MGRDIHGGGQSKYGLLAARLITANTGDERVRFTMARNNKILKFLDRDTTGIVFVPELACIRIDVDVDI